MQKEEGVLDFSQKVLRRTKLKTFLITTIVMKIFRAIGFGLALVIIRLAMPEVFEALEDTLLEFFNFLQTVLSFGDQSFENGMRANILTPASLDLVP